MRLHPGHDQNVLVFSHVSLYAIMIFNNYTVYIINYYSLKNFLKLHFQRNRKYIYDFDFLFITNKKLNVVFQVDSFLEVVH